MAWVSVGCAAQPGGGDLVWVRSQCGAVYLHLTRHYVPAMALSCQSQDVADDNYYSNCLH